MAAEEDGNNVKSQSTEIVLIVCNVACTASWPVVDD